MPVIQYVEEQNQTQPVRHQASREHRPNLMDTFGKGSRLRVSSDRHGTARLLQTIDNPDDSGVQSLTHYPRCCTPVLASPSLAAVRQTQRAMPGRGESKLALCRQIRRLRSLRRHQRHQGTANGRALRWALFPLRSAARGRLNVCRMTSRAGFGMRRFTAFRKIRLVVQSTATSPSAPGLS